MKYILDLQRNNVKAIQKEFEQQFLDMNQDPKMVSKIIEMYQVSPEEYFFDSLVPLKYPGSMKGLRMEDDPEGFSSFYFSNISDSLFGFYSMANKFI